MSLQLYARYLAANEAMRICRKQDLSPSDFGFLLKKVKIVWSFSDTWTAEDFMDDMDPDDLQDALEYQMEENLDMMFDQYRATQRVS